MTALLEEGADPTASDGQGRKAYWLCKFKSTRDAFRRHMAAHPEAWDWTEAGVHEALTPEQDAQRAKKRVGCRVCWWSLWPKVNSRVRDSVSWSLRKAGSGQVCTRHTAWNVWIDLPAKPFSRLSPPGSFQLLVDVYCHCGAPHDGQLQQPASLDDRVQVQAADKQRKKERAQEKKAETAADREAAAAASKAAAQAEVSAASAQAAEQAAR